MRKNVGCFVLEINNDQYKQLMQLVNHIAVQSDINFSVFTLDYGVVLNSQKYFTILPIYEAKYYFGKMFVFDLASLDLVVRFPNIEQIIYYQNDAYPWVLNPNVPQAVWDKLFGDKRIKIITDKLSVKQEMDKRFSIDCSLLQTINPEALYNVI